MPSFAKKLLVITCILLLTGCATVTPSQKISGIQPLTWPQRKAQLLKIHSWQLQGAFSIQQQQRVQMAHLRWNQAANKQYQLVISGPFNLGGVKINGRPGFVVLEKSAQQKYYSTSPEGLLREQLGYQLPISNLYYWVRGVPAPDAAANVELDNLQHLVQLKQQGWVIQYNNFTTVNGVDLPTQVLLNNLELKIRLVIKQWRLS